MGASPSYGACYLEHLLPALQKTDGRNNSVLESIITGEITLRVFLLCSAASLVSTRDALMAHIGAHLKQDAYSVYTICSLYCVS